MTYAGKVRPHASSLAVVTTAFGFSLLYIPLVSLVIYSFLMPASSDLLGPKIWSLAWYRKLLENEAILNAFSTSLYVGIGTTLGATLIGTSSALALTRLEFPGKKILDILTYIPMIMPEIVLGLSLLIWFVMLKITLGSMSIIIAHITFSASYVVMTVKSRLDGFDEALEEAARDLGANSWNVFWKVTFPLIAPGIGSGALMAFTLSFDDFLITYFTAGVGTDTLPIKIYSMIKFGVTPEINALSTILLGCTLLLVGFLYKPLKSNTLHS